MQDMDEHVFAGVQPFGLRRYRAICRCGYAATPVEGLEIDVAETARQVLFEEHAARDLRPGEPVGGVLIGEAGPVRPKPSPPWTSPTKESREEPPRRLQ